MSFLKNTWYAFGYAGEVASNALVHRTICDEPILVYRKVDGQLTAIRDICPHRFVPLHMGERRGDFIQCAYHGLQFGPDGKCVKTPVAGTPIPKAAFVRSFPVAERHSLIWIWMGSPETADEDLIADFAFLTDPSREHVGGYKHLLADYQLAIDNLSDLTHVQFVHASHQASEAFERLQFKVEQAGETVLTHLTFPNGKPPFAFQRAVENVKDAIDLKFETRWNVPSCVRLRITGNPAGGSQNQLFESLSAHILSPETERTSHYFFVNSRDYGIGDPEVSERVRAWQKQGFDVEDRAILEAQQRCIRDQDIMTLGPVLLATDAGAIRVRRVLGARLKLEGQPYAPAERVS